MSERKTNPKSPEESVEPKRNPASFPMERKDKKTAEEPSIRAPRAIKVDEDLTVTHSYDDDFELDDAIDATQQPSLLPRRRFRWGGIFATAFGLLVTLALGLWVDQLIRNLFTRADWLGWLATGLAGITALAFVVIVAREVLAVLRLASAEKINALAEKAYAENDPRLAQSSISSLVRLLESHPDTAAGRKVLADIEGDIIDGRDLLAIAERELLAPLDRRAQRLVLEAARRVSIVTAVSPRALVDIGYVIFESARLIRRLSELYCGRPGFFGFMRLLRSVVAHLAVTSSIALSDGLVQQILGHGIAARLSARLGEGVVNGMMTARIGIAAIAAIRPMEFHASPRPSMGDIMRALTRANPPAGGAGPASTARR